MYIWVKHIFWSIFSSQQRVPQKHLGKRLQSFLQLSLFVFFFLSCRLLTAMSGLSHWVKLEKNLVQLRFGTVTWYKKNSYNSNLSNYTFNVHVQTSKKARNLLVLTWNPYLSLTFPMARNLPPLLVGPVGKSSPTSNHNLRAKRWSFDGRHGIPW